MARPKKNIDAEQVEALAGINCTTEEIASVLGCSKDTLERRFAANLKKGRHHGRSSLRRKMWKKVEDGNITMMIWLSKQMLGYKDKIEEQATVKTQEVIQIDWADEGDSEDKKPMH
jgi:AraC-like DNA-binding protein